MGPSGESNAPEVIAVGEPLIALLAIGSVPGLPAPDELERVIGAGAMDTIR